MVHYKGIMGDLSEREPRLGSEGKVKERVARVWWNSQQTKVRVLKLVAQACVKH